VQFENHRLACVEGGRHPTFERLTNVRVPGVRDRIGGHRLGRAIVGLLEPEASRPGNDPDFSAISPRCSSLPFRPSADTGTVGAAGNNVVKNFYILDQETPAQYPVSGSEEARFRGKRSSFS
jgi:hypothetical protein